MTRPRFSLTHHAILAVAAAASVTSLGCFEPDTYWFHLTRGSIAPHSIEADEWVTYRIDASLGFTADDGLESLTLKADLEARADSFTPNLTIELGAGEGDTLVYAHTEPGQEGAVSTKMSYQALGTQDCELPDTGWTYCEFVFYLHVHTDVAAELRGRITWSPQGRTHHDRSGASSEVRVQRVEEDEEDAW